MGDPKIADGFDGMSDGMSKIENTAVVGLPFVSPHHHGGYDFAYSVGLISAR